MPAIIVCHICEQRLTDASNAMRRHMTDMNRGLTNARIGYSEEEQKDFRHQLYASFNAAQSAWDAYREHLVEHGLLPSMS